MKRSRFALSSLFLLLTFSAPFWLNAQRFEFALIGDMPYQDVDVEKFGNLVEELNRDKRIKWVMHTGDIKTGATPCTEAYFQSRLDLYQQINKPFIITPGDNEWTDCHRPGAGQYKPLERLALLRKMFYPNPRETLGKKTMPISTQMDIKGFEAYPENQRWQKKGIWFVTCHIVGSQNGLAPFAGRTAADDQEVKDRVAAAIAWLKDTFEKAKNAPGIFIMIHANPKLENAAKKDQSKGFYEFLAVLEEEVIQFGKPVVLAHGDSHYFRYDKPLVNRKTRKRIENFTRLEAFGASDIHWVRVSVNAKDPNVFNIKQQLVKANFER